MATGVGTAVLPHPRLDDAALRALTLQLAERAGEHDRSALLSSSGVQQVYEAGLLTATIAPAFGGPGISLGELLRAIRAIAAGDPSVALVSAMTLLVHLRAGHSEHWPAALYQRIVAESRTRPVLLNNLRSEPDLGATARGGLPSTTARRRYGGWEIQGVKSYSTGGDHLDYRLVWAVTDEPTPRVGTFVVPREARGQRVIPTWDHLGLRATESHDIVFERVVVPLDDVLGLSIPDAVDTRLGAGFEWFVVVLSAIYLGIAESAASAFADFSWRRIPTPLGRPIAQTDRIRSIAGEIAREILIVRSLLERVARRVDEGGTVGAAELGLVKTASTHSSIRAVELAVAALGNPGLTRAHSLERHLRDVLCARVHAPQDDVGLIAAGVAALDALRPPVPDRARSRASDYAPLNDTTSQEGDPSA